MQCEYECSKDRSVQVKGMDTEDSEAYPILVESDDESIFLIDDESSSSNLWCKQDEFDKSEGSTVEETAKENTTKQDLEVKPFCFVDCGNPSTVFDQEETVEGVENNTRDCSTQCEETFTGLSEHQLVDCKSRDISTQCEETFTGLSDHQLVNCKSHREFICEDCGKGYTCRPDFVRHLQTHSSEQAFKCNFCNLIFSQKADLAKHEIVHLEKSPTVQVKPTHIKCTICDKCFTRKSGLNQHYITMHSTDKPFLCTICKRGFADKSNLRKHQKVHSVIKPFKCNLCSQGFYHRFSLKQHILKCKFRKYQPVKQTK